MASQQDIKRRIRSVRNTRKITKALELVSASKLRRAQSRIEALRPYADRMHELEMEAASRADVHGQPLLVRRETKVGALCVLTGDRGLAGAFNAQVLRAAIADSRKARAAGQEMRWLAVGKRGIGSLRFRGLELLHSWQGFTDRPSYSDASAIADELCTLYRDGTVDRVALVYNAFESALTQRVVVEELLPIPEGRLEDVSPRDRALEGIVIFEPEAADMLDQLLQTSIEIQIYRALLESTASEHGARMTAMGNASKNANELIDGLTLAMNRARQAEITQEILEVVAGADALE
ncbi:MAG: F-type H+-transporting ATPase subunit gamma [Gaiellales bacterium]|nr:F-type H+-transporting ATPase subunit gamma [Gaiellales bacterium]